jgi:hypothetical protein
VDSPEAVTPGQGQRRSDLEALTDVCNLIPLDGRAWLMGHALNVIECMGSLARAATLEHASLMIDETLKSVRRLCEYIEKLEGQAIEDSAKIDAKERAGDPAAS